MEKTLKPTSRPNILYLRDTIINEEVATEENSTLSKLVRPKQHHMS